LGLEEYLEGDGICIIEWADRMLELLPEHHIRLQIRWEDEFTRTIELRCSG
jgi:tRNA threonylcarbamoyladenosine biosynthesis protein TsaE